MIKQSCGICKKPFSKGQLKFKVKGRTSMWYKEAEVCYKCKTKIYGKK